MRINKLINNHKIQFDKFFFDLMKANLNRSILSKAMIYGSMNGGKRIRPFLVSQAAKIAKAENLSHLLISFLSKKLSRETELSPAILTS